MKSFKLTRRAKSDLFSIARYTQGRWGKQRRDLYLQTIDQAFKKLSQNPDLGQNCDYIRAGYRKLSQGKHLIFYKQDASENILIIRILHKQMDVISQLK